MKTTYYYPPQGSAKVWTCVTNGEGTYISTDEGLTETLATPDEVTKIKRLQDVLYKKLYPQFT